VRDDLEREMFKENLQQQNKQHTNSFTHIIEWINAKKNYLEQKNTVNSIEEAQANLVALSLYEEEKGEKVNSVIKNLNELGASILAASYRGLTNYLFENPDEITTREEEVATLLNTLGEKEGPKREILEDDLKREQFKENLRQQNELHKRKFSGLESWAAEKQEYLQKKEEVNSVMEAEENLTNFNAYKKNKTEITDGEIEAFRVLGRKILEAKYDELTSYVFENPDSIRNREEAISKEWDSLDEFALSKEQVLKDDFDRELFKENLEQENEKHKNQHQALIEWCNEQVAYLDKLEQVESIADAEKNLADLKAFNVGKEDTLRGAVVSLKERGEQIVGRKYHTKLSSYAFPTPQEPRAREMEINAAFEKLQTMVPKKYAILNDDLQRELFKEDLRQNNEQHKVRFEELKEWVNEKMKYLHNKERVDSIRKAQENINAHDAYEEDKLIKTDGNVTAWKSLGQSIINTVYQTQYSTWRWQTPDEIVELEKCIDDDWGMLDVLSATKKEILNDDLNRELFKEKLRQENEQHKRKYEDLLAWISSKKEYLETKEECDSISTAERNLNDCLSFMDDKNIMSNGMLIAFKRLGTDIISDNLETRLSSWIWPFPDKVRARESEIEEAWLELDDLCKTKKAWLEDDLSREIYKDKVIQQSEQHTQKFKELEQWVTQKKNYLEIKEEVDSISASEFNLNALATYMQEKEIITGGKVAVFKALGKDIMEAEYATELSEWKFPTPDDLETNETKIDEYWEMLEELSQTKKERLEDDREREKFKEKLRQDNEQHKKMTNDLLEWITQKKEYLNIQDSVNSIAGAQYNLGVLLVYDEDKKNRTNGSIQSLQKLGAEIVEAKYQSSLSSYEFLTPDEISGRETDIDQEWKTLDELRDKKLRIQEDDLEREKFKEKLCRDNEQHKNKQNEIMAWIQEKKTYLEKKNSVDSVQSAQINICNFESYKEELRIMIAGSIANLKNDGQAILDAQYETEFSDFKFQTPKEITEREADIDRAVAMLSDIAENKNEMLEDDRRREEFRDKLRQDDQNHLGKYKSILSWVKEKKEYLNTSEPVTSIRQIQENIATLKAYMSEKIDTTNGPLTALKTMGRAITTARYQTKFSSFVFPDSKIISGREQELTDAWAELDQLYKQKQNVLNDDLLREQFKEKILLSNAQHIEQYKAIQNWISSSCDYMNQRVQSGSVANAINDGNQLSCWRQDKVDQTKSAFANLKKLGEYIKTTKYSSALSKYIFENVQEVDERENNILSGFDKLERLSAEKQQFIEHDLVCEEKKEELRLNFADIVGDFVRWQKNTCNEAGTAHFGFTLAEVEKYAPTIKIHAQSIRLIGPRKIRVAKEVFNELKNVYGDKAENVYTGATLTSLDEGLKKVEQALESKAEAFRTELARQRDLDGLCKKLAKLVEPFIQNIDKSKTRVTESKQDLNGQTSLVRELLASTTGKKITQQLSAINDMQAKLDAKGIISNQHTTLCAFDATFQLEQFKKFLTIKKQNLEEEIKHQEMKGVTKEELEEIKSHFEKFDKNANSYLTTTEFRRCLYSVGDERGPIEIKRIMREFGGDDGMDLEGFEEFWIQKLGDTDTSEEIIDSFAILNGERAPSVELAEQREAIMNNKPAKPIRCTYMIKSSRMKLWMSEEDQKYLAETATAVQEEGDGNEYFNDLAGYYYQGWVDDVFSR